MIQYKDDIVNSKKFLTIFSNYLNRNGSSSLKHKANSMASSTWKSNEMWYVDSRALNHMTNHKDWFSTLERPKHLGVVEIGDDTPPRGIMRNVLHVLTITKNLVSIEKIVNRGMQVCFTHLECFIEQEGQIIAQGRREWRMFILKTNNIDIRRGGVT